MMKLIYTICFKNSTNENFAENCFANDSKLIRRKKSKKMFQKNFSSRIKKCWDLQVLSNFPKNIYDRNLYINVLNEL